MAQRPQQPSRPDSEEVIKYMKAQGLEGATSVQLDTTNPSRRFGAINGPHIFGLDLHRQDVGRGARPATM